MTLVTISFYRFYMFRPMTVHRQKVSSGIQALRYNVMTKCELYCGE